MLGAERVEHGAQACSYEEVLLLEAEEPPVLAGVVGVEDGADRLRLGAMRLGLRVVAGVEGIEVEFLLDRLGAPHAELVHRVPAEAYHGDVVGDSEHVVGALGVVHHAAVLLDAHHVAAEADTHGLVLAAHLPGVAVDEPVVGGLVLGTVLDFLLEEAVAVAHTVAVAGDALVGHGVEEARGEATQAAVAERRVAFVLLERLEVRTELLEGFGHEVVHAEVQQIVIEQASDEEFDGEVVHALLAGIVHALLGIGLHGARLARHELYERLEAVDVARVLEGFAGKRCDRR